MEKSNKQLAVSQIVSAIISKNSSITSVSDGLNVDCKSTYGTDVFFEENGEITLADTANERTSITLSHLISYVSKCLDESS